MSREVVVRGEGFMLAFELEGYVFPEASTGWQANVLSTTTRLEIRKAATFMAKIRTEDFLTSEFAAFRDDLDAVLRTLSGNAVFQHGEGNVEVTVTLDHGKGAIAASVRQDFFGGGELTVAGFETDQSYLGTTLKQLDDAVTEFPVRGDIYG